MSRGLAENRKNKWKKIRERKKKYQDYFGPQGYIYGEVEEKIPNGVFANNHILNHGGHTKTRTKNAYASYRHKGGYGKAEKWCSHDRRQIEDMEQQMEEVENENKFSE